MLIEFKIRRFGLNSREDNDYNEGGNIRYLTRRDGRPLDFFSKLCKRKGVYSEV
jgi:hypothetical protein